MNELRSFKDALKSAKIKSLLPTTLKTRELSALPSDILERARFSAQTSNAVHVQAIDDTIESILHPKNVGGTTEGMDYSTGRLALKKSLDSISYEPTKPGTIEDLGSDQRLNLILETNVQMAQGYGNYVQQQAAIDSHPCLELVRIGRAQDPRDWPSIWEEAGGDFYEGRMIAPANDPIWEAISDFGLPYPPFKFGSHMWTRAVSRKEAEELGVIEEGEDVVPKERDFNDGLQMSVEGLTASFRATLLESVGDAFRFIGDVLTANEDQPVNRLSFHRTKLRAEVLHG